ncbi:MAG: tetratricopeptide repeat protein [Phycisphaerales bacterium]|jgi:tetratricopeptide (TPR) repeat protein|nr:tetratricopeptide repeat protein [Phycisphaerales bacterium]|tara:strand:+ start:1129 stop:1866 length:738 start_codon:yes stop_codon:yes gene_type:complete
MVLTGLCCLLMGGCEPENPDPAPVPAMTGELVEHYNLILAGQYGPARVRLRQRIDTAPGDGRAHFLMGLAHHHERAYSKAVPWFERALAADPPYPPAAHFLGWAFYHAGDANKSQAAFERHLQLDPNEGDTHFGLGVLALERGDLNDADAFFENAIALQRSNPDRRGGVAKSLARRSEVLEQRGDVAGAVSMLAEAVSMEPDLHEALYRQARLLRRLGRDDEATATEAAANDAKARVESSDGRPR